MSLIAHEAQKQWRAGESEREGLAASRLPVQAGHWTSPVDYEVEWPDSDESELIVIYTPDYEKGLTDPRQRVLQYDMDTNVREEWDRYPPRYSISLAMIMFLLIGGATFLAWRWSRPLQKTFEFDGRLAQKQMLNDIDAKALIERMRSRDA